MNDIVTTAKALKIVQKHLAKLTDDKYKVQRNIREELRNMNVAISVRDSDVDKSGKAYSFLIPEASEREDLGTLNEHIVKCVAYRERINKLLADLIDVKRALDTLYDDLESSIYSKLGDSLASLRTDKLRTQVIDKVARPIVDRLRIVDDLMEICTSTTWTLKSIQDGIQLMCENTHRSSPIPR